MSLSFGTAVFILVTRALCTLTGRPLGQDVVRRLGVLLAIFVAVVLYFTAVQHLSNLYVAEHAGVERFILFDGGLYTQLFWIGQILIGGVLPLILIFAPGFAGRPWAAVFASVLVVLGGMAQIYVIVIGGQAYPMEVFPGYDATSTFADGAVAAYAPSLPELLLGLGGVAIALLATGVAATVLRILPTNLSDANVGS